VFLTAASCPKKDFYTPLTLPKKTTYNRLLYCILKIAHHLYCVLKKVLKSSPKDVGKKVAKKTTIKVAKKAAKKSLFLNLSCCCHETGLKLVLLFYFLTLLLSIISRSTKGENG